MYKYEEAFEKSLAYFDGDELASSVFLGKYALKNDDGLFLEATPDDMHKRIAKEFARIESEYDNPLSESEIYSLLKDFKYIVPQGSPMSGIGNNIKIQSLSNCFVIESPYDSYGGILKTDQEQVQIMKRRGGVGFDISTIRPQGLKTSNAANTTDGIEVFMDRFSNSCREVAQGGRRGALMLTISVHHPQIREFVKIKQDLTRVTGANISIRISDEFMNAVKSGSEVQLRWPVDSDDPDIVEQADARKLWDSIIESAHLSAEPGILFWDTAKSMTPSDIYTDKGFGSTSTNPCGEIILSPYDSCRLMLVNLTSFVTERWTSRAEFDSEKFSDVVQKAQRLMDDMINLEIKQIDKIIDKIHCDPEPESVKKIEIDLWENIRSAAVKGRRTGLGITGLGDMLAMLGLTYGSKKSIKMTEKVYKLLSVNSYESSIQLAKERGAFPVFNLEKELDHKFISRIVKEMLPNKIKDYKKYGRRNIANTTTAPAGSVSVLTQTTSGIEPAFMLHYKRRKKINLNDETATVDFIDDSGDKWTEFNVYHHGFKKWLDAVTISGVEWDDNDLPTAISNSPYAGATANEIDWVAKVKMQSAAQKWVCHAISNTTNLPADVDVETVKQVYMKGWELGCKGVTVYREGARTGVLVDASSVLKDRDEMMFEDNSAPKRPEVLDCEIHQANIKGDAWTILIGLMNGRPYEVIGGRSEYVEIPRKYKYGKIRRRARKSVDSKYDLIVGKNGDEFIIKDIITVFDNPNHSSFTRTISLALRHGAPIQYAVEQLQKDKDADLFSFSKVIARCLKKHIKDGTVGGDKDCIECNAQNSLVYQEGCITCKSCGYSKCG
jgi:ribonucleoside-diphosphate reductase alpha chain